MSGLTPYERFLLIEMRNEIGDLDASLDQILKDMGDGETEVRLDDVKRSLAALSEEFSGETERGVPDQIRLP
ncbi:hypothetical protein ACIQUG_15190 [Ensifer sp. NPDC090286]|uniref:hypothetical protein n=1 Tax=Ensifer sp. NPDC090286 TaxID=3363991 RepID=UPI00383BAAB2